MKHGGCLHQYGRGSTRTAFRLLQRNEKNSVRLNEACIRSVRRASQRRSHRARVMRHRARRMRRSWSSAICRNCENSDEIRTYCDNNFPSIPRRNENLVRTRVQVCISIACRNNKCTGQNFFHNLPRKTTRADRNRAKTSESVTGDSGRARTPRRKFSRSTHADSKLKRNFAHTIAALHPNRMQARD